ncbi:MAG: flagellar hook-associated protein FlgK [Gemmatimonadetes bacterium SCN 70-22]|nr:MAG: flagellar hook-associated protein FlgK [Gemmatimonadetes bacterium SCN 70-22]
MAGIFGLLGIARSGMLASQQAVDVTGQNVANVHTPGYTRQRVDQVALPSVYLPPAGHFGVGTMVTDVARTRDALLDQVYRANAGGAGAASAREDGLSRLEGIFGEPSSSGLAAGLDAFWNGWSDLASDPTSLAARGVVQQRGAAVASQLNRFAAQIDTLANDGRQRAQLTVDEINSLVAQVAGLNRDIVAAESGGHTANTLRDTRDLLLDRLAAHGDLQVTEAADGSVGVRLGGLLLVDSADPGKLTLSSIGGRWQVASARTPDRPVDVGGALQATLDLVNDDYPEAMATLDGLARALVGAVNGIHQSGELFGTTPPVAAPEFFRTDPLAPTPEADPFRTARGIRLGVQVAADLRNIAAGDAGTGASNTGVASRLAALRDTPVTFVNGSGVPETETIGNIHRGLVTGVALRVSRAESNDAVQRALVQSADARRASVSGVSQDEELANLIKYQQSYAAAARLITVADELAQTLIGMAR